MARTLQQLPQFQARPDRRAGRGDAQAASGHDGEPAELAELLSDLSRLVELGLIEPITDDSGATRLRPTACETRR